MSNTPMLLEAWYMQWFALALWDSEAIINPNQVLFIGKPWSGIYIISKELYMTTCIWAIVDCNDRYMKTFMHIIWIMSYQSKVDLLNTMVDLIPKSYNFTRKYFFPSYILQIIQI